MSGFVSYENYCADLPDANFTAVGGPYTGSASNLRDARLSRGLVLDGPGTFEVRVDLGSVKEIDCVGLFGINQQVGTITAGLNLSPTDAYAGGIYFEEADLPYEPNKTGKIIWLPDQSGVHSARYISITIPDCLAGRGAGMLWIGNKFELPFDKNFTLDWLDNTAEYISEGQETQLRKYPNGRYLEATFPRILLPQAIDGIAAGPTYEALKWALGSKGFAVISPRQGTPPNDPNVRAMGALYVTQASRLKHEAGQRFSASLTAREEVGHP